LENLHANVKGIWETNFSTFSAGAVIVLTIWQFAFGPEKDNLRLEPVFYGECLTVT
jgi:hypothetical protein